MARPKLEDVTDRLAMRIDERVRYLAEIGARAQGMSFREYLEWALEHSFHDVQLRKPSRRTEPSVVQINGRNVFVKRSDSDGESSSDTEQQLTLAEAQVGLWHDTPYRRLIALQTIIHGIQSADGDQSAERLLSLEQKRMWGFLWQHEEFLTSARNGKRLNERYIEENWDAIYRRAQEVENIAPTEAKTKDGE